MCRSEESFDTIICSDLHFMEIDSELETSSGRHITLHVTDTEDETLRRIEAPPVQKNFTFVLRSTLPTTWTLKVSNVQGHVTIFLVSSWDCFEINTCVIISFIASGWWRTSRKQVVSRRVTVSEANESSQGLRSSHPQSSDDRWTSSFLYSNRSPFYHSARGSR